MSSMSLEALQPGRDGEPAPRRATPRELWETDPERKKKIRAEHEKIGQRFPNKARKGNCNNKRGKNKTH